MRIVHGDCLDVLPTLAENSIDSVVTDPPYGLGFMGKKWDGDVAFRRETWAWIRRVAKPGAYLLAFGGTRTHHRMMCAIEDGGWELRDTLMWIFGSGFPKSANGAWGGSALKPAYEPIILARKPLQGTLAANFAKWGTGGLAIDDCRIETDEVGTPKESNDRADRESWRMAGGTNGSGASSALGRWPANIIHDGSEEVVALFPQAVGQIADASSSSSRKTQNVYGAMNRGNGRDGEASADSDNDGDVGFKMKPGARRGDEGSAARFFYCPKADRSDRNDGCEGMPAKALNWSSGEQSPGTFQSPNTDRSARNHHPTVKPTDLMRYLCRLVTPKDGTVLDPFMGSGSTLKAAELEGFSAVGIELSAEYVEIARRRIASDMPLFREVGD